jgi:hypothetical protein
LTDSLAVAQLLNTAARNLTTTGSLVTFNTTNALKNSTVSSNTITVTNAGTYLVNYGFTSPGAEDAAMSLYVNGTENTGTRLTLIEEGHVSASILLTLAAGSTVSLGVSVLPDNVTLPTGTLNAYVVITPIYA